MTDTGLRPRDGESPVGLQKPSHIGRPWRIGIDIEPSHEPPPYPIRALRPIVPTDLSSANHPAHQIKHQPDEPLEHRPIEPSRIASRRMRVPTSDVGDASISEIMQNRLDQPNHAVMNSPSSEVVLRRIDATLFSTSC
jgi:hypothetical protein